MPPSAIIDSDWNGSDYYALEVTKLWKTSNITAGGAATWAEVLNTSTFTDISITGFARVRVSGSTIYVLGAVNDTDVYLFKSSSGGLTWSYSLIETNAVTTTPYTVKHYADSATTGSQQWPGYEYVDRTINIERLGDDINTYNPWAMAWSWASGAADAVITGGAHVLCQGKSQILNDATTVNDFGGSFIEQNPLEGTSNWLLGGGASGPGKDYLDDYFGAGNWSQAAGIDRDMPLDEARTTVQWRFACQAAGATGIFEVWIFWNVPEINIPAALDYAKTNPNWVYVGLEDKIMASEDGGVTWFEFQGSHGAYDICVDPQLAGAVYYWSSEGSLNLMTKQTLGAAGVITSAGLDTETPTKIPLRLARDTNSGRLWAIPGGATLRCRNNAAWTDQKTGLSSARGLHAYTGGKMIFCDGSDIYTSEDYGATITARKGGWSGYGSGVNAHRLAA